MLPKNVRPQIAQEWLIDTTIDFNLFGKKVYKEIRVADPFGNHSMSAVKKALKK